MEKTRVVYIESQEDNVLLGFSDGTSVLLCYELVAELVGDMWDWATVYGKPN